MKNRLIQYSAVSILIVLVMVLFSAGVFAQTAIEDTRNSVIRVVVFEAGTEEFVSAGTGFVVGDEEPFEFVATCAHVVDIPEADAELDIFIWRAKDDLIPASIHVTLVDSDLALLKLDPQHLLHGLESLELGRMEDISIGDRVYAVGFPAVADWGFSDFPTAYPEDATVTEGIVGKFTTFEGAAFLQIDASVSWGSSGGPLVDENGQVVGIVSRAAVLEGIYGAVKVDYLSDLLRSRGIAYKAGYELAEPPAILEEISFVDLASVFQAGEEITLQASILNLADEVRDLEVSFFVDGNLISTVTAAEVEPDMSETVSATWKAEEPGDFVLSASSGMAEIEKAVLVEATGLTANQLIIALAVAALVIIILAVVLITRRRQPAMAAVAQPSTQPGPATKAGPEGSAPAVTQAKRKQARPVIKGVAGNFAGQTLELVDNQLIIGRDPRLSQLVYPREKEQISRKHATIRFDERTHKFTLIDSSSNGTYLSSNQRLEPGENYYLNSGERFYLSDPSEVFEVKVE